MKTQTLETRRTFALQTIAALRQSIANERSFDQVEIQALIYRLELCNSDDNQFTITGTAEHGIIDYEPQGQFWRCRSKLCPHCVATQSRRTRHKLRAAWSRQQLASDERYYFPTLTIKNPGFPLRQTREIVNYAWSLFRKRSLCRDLVIGGSKSEEFTVTPNGYHYHLHLLIRAKFIWYDEYRRVWTECVQKACRKFNAPLDVTTRDGMYWIKFEKIVDERNVIYELCKYLTKSDSWEKIKTDDLRELALIKRWHRMFELFGSFSPPKDDTAFTLLDDDTAEGVLTIVHKRSLSDGGKSAGLSNYWRERVHRIGTDDYKHDLLIEFTETVNFRIEQLMQNFPLATLEIGYTSLE